MPYRKVGYLEQCWYIVRYKLREVLRKDDHHAKKAEAPVRVSGLSQPDGQSVLSPAREDRPAAVRQVSEKSPRE